MKKIYSFVFIILFASSTFAQKIKEVKTVPQDYFPAAQNWEHRSLSSFNIDSNKINDAIQFAKMNEAKLPRNQEIAQAMTFGKEPFSDAIGPLEERGDPSGIIIYKGYIIAEWGDVNKVDMTNSVTKSFLSTVVGLAVDKGLIRSTNDIIAPYIPPIEVFDNNPYRSANEIGKSQLLYPFSSAHNKKLSWEVMLRQTSDWEGTLWGKPDWADRPNDKSNEWLTRKRNEPGTVWKYNDTRVNALALATTCVWRRPLPEVFREYIMNPIGASNTWHWTGYRNSWIVLDGKLIQSVSGGGHFGGGVFINAFDMARFGLLTLHKGNWNGKQLISEQWINQSTTPTTANIGYGYMNYFLNVDKKLLPSAPADAFVHIGNGTNLIYVDKQHDIVAVVRWLENNAMDGVIKRILDALNK